jgi:hypothetical protein
MKNEKQLKSLKPGATKKEQRGSTAQRGTRWEEGLYDHWVKWTEQLSRKGENNANNFNRG